MPVNTTDDSAVIREVLSGRTEAFRALVERYFATVRFVALAKTGNVADAEDVAQETFIKAYETLGVLRNRERLAPWLVAIARNLAISLVRRRERERRHAESYPIDSIIHPDHERRETLDAVARQVDALPENLREVVLLHYFEGLKCREIGERLDLNTNAVVKRLSRGRDLLGDRLLREWAGERKQAAPSVHRVMGAIAALPRPDWTAQTAAMGGAGAGATLKAGGLAATLIASPLAFKMFTAVSVVALGVLYIALNVRGGGDDSPTASAGTSAPVTEKGLIAAATSGAGDLFNSTFADDETDGPVSVAIEPPLPPPPMAEVGFVSGLVTDVNGVPVGDAVVFATGGKKTGQATSNPNGDFRVNLSAPVPAIEAGEVSKYVNVSCSMPGFVPRVVPDVPLGSSNVQVVLARPSVISGKVVDAEKGAPITEFSLRIDGPYQNPDSGEHINPQTREFRSDSGEFRLEAPYGIESLWVEAENYVSRQEYLGLAQGESRGEVILTVERGGVVHGLVFDETSRAPIPDFRVVARFGDGQRASGFNTDGSFALSGLPLHGPVTLDVDAHGYAGQTIACTVNTEENPVSVYLGRGGSVRGRVLYQGGPPPGSDKARIEDGYCRVNVWAVDEVDGPGGLRLGGMRGDYAYVRPDGTYEVTGLKDGFYRADAFYWPGKDPDSHSTSKLVMVREGESTELDLSYDEAGGEIDIQLSGVDDSAVVRVELRSSAAPDFVLDFQSSNPVAFEEILRRVEFSRLEPGPYLLRVYGTGDEAHAIEETVNVVERETVDLVVDMGAFGVNTNDVTDGEGGEVAAGDESGE